MPDILLSHELDLTYPTCPGPAARTIMLYHTSCPKCGDKRSFVAEEVGNVVDCKRCDGQFPLVRPRSKMGLLLVVGVAVLMAGISGYLCFSFVQAGPFGGSPGNGGGRFGSSDEGSGLLSTGGR